MVARVTILNVVVPLPLEAPQRHLQLELPEELVRLLQVQADQRSRSSWTRSLKEDRVELSNTLIRPTKWLQYHIPELSLEIQSKEIK